MCEKMYKFGITFGKGENFMISRGKLRKLTSVWERWIN
jgi:hypothetical protein